MSDLSTPKSGRLSGRTKEEIDRDFRENCRKGAESILRIGYDLTEMKALCEHGEWLEWLNKVGWKERTAQNYMRVARTWNENPNLMSMGYTRTVALLAAPAEVQEMATDGQLDNASAAEIKRLSKELRDAERKVRESESKVRAIESQVCKNEPEIREVEKIVEKIPEDYELIKRQLRMAEDAAEDAEKRAAEAVRQAQEAMEGQADPYAGPDVSAFVGAVNRFLAEAGSLPYAEDWLRTMGREDRQSVKLFTNSVWHWAENMPRALEADRLVVIPGEGAVSNE